MRSLKLQVREPENGGRLRRIPVLQCVFALPMVPVPFFGRRDRGTWKSVEKGDRHGASSVFSRV